MSSGNHRPKANSASFEDVLDLGSVPPPPGGVVGPDVHAARTAIAAMPSSLLEELRRAKNDPEASRTRRQEKFELPSLEKRGASSTNEAPTAPGKDGMRLLRPLAPDVNDPPPSPPASDLVSAVVEAATAAAAAAREAVTEAPPPSSAQAPAPAVAVVKTPPMPVPAPVISAAVMAPVPVPPPIAASTPPLPVITPISTPAPVPIIASMADQLEPEDPRPSSVRIELLVAFVIVAGTGLVFALLAIADRLLSHR